LLRHHQPERPLDAPGVDGNAAGFVQDPRPNPGQGEISARVAFGRGPAQYAPLFQGIPFPGGCFMHLPTRLTTALMLLSGVAFAGAADTSDHACGSTAAGWNDPTGTT